MTKISSYILLLCFFLSCDGDKIDKPANLIPESQMVDIIVDFTLLNSGQGLDKTVFEKEGIKPKEFIYAKYGIDSIQFIKSNEYYSHDIDVYQDIYLKVRSRLDTKKEAYKKLNEAETKARKVKDSIRRAEKKREKDSLLKINGKALKVNSLLGKDDSSGE